MTPNYKQRYNEGMTPPPFTLRPFIISSSLLSPCKWPVCVFFFFFFTFWAWPWSGPTWPRHLMSWANNKKPVLCFEKQRLMNSRFKSETSRYLFFLLRNDPWHAVFTKSAAKDTQSLINSELLPFIKLEQTLFRRGYNEESFLSGSLQDKNRLADEDVSFKELIRRTALKEHLCASSFCSWTPLNVGL